MSLSNYSKILREYEVLKDNQLKELERKKNEIYQKFPRIKEIDETIANLSLEITKTILKNPQDVHKLISSLEQKSMDLKIEKSEILASNNYSTDYLMPKYVCKLCHDTGFIDRIKCKCLVQKLINLAYKESNMSNLFLEQNFDNFDFEFYSDKICDGHGLSPRENIKEIYKTCIDYANKFDTTNENLLFTGSPGLGKTFLSSCIAKELLDSGKTVYYQTAFKIFNILEEYQFSKNKSEIDREKIDILFDVDLLIIDDLGSEFINSYTTSEFFNVLNTRLLQQKKTIISTNLSLSELLKNYSARVASRIIGHYKVLEFFGDDIRKKITERNLA